MGVQAVRCMQVVMSDSFDAFIMGVIVLNVGCLALTYVGAPLWLTRALDWLNIIFTFTFAIEAVAKMIALGLKSYFQDRWCMFDCLVATLSLVQIAIDKWTTSDIPAISLLRVFRVTRIFRLIPKVRPDRAAVHRAALCRLLLFMICDATVCRVDAVRSADVRLRRSVRRGVQVWLTRSIHAGQRAAHAAANACLLASSFGQRWIGVLSVHVHLCNHGHEPLWRRTVGRILESTRQF